MINASELMKGNLVTFSDIDQDYSIIPIKIGVIDVDSVWAFIDDDYALDELGYEDISPILLTEEILIKNFSEPDEMVWFPLEKGGLHCETRTKGDIMFSGIFKYVHQLQNALSIAGIDKEIRL